MTVFFLLWCCSVVHVVCAEDIGSKRASWHRCRILCGGSLDFFPTPQLHPNVMRKSDFNILSKHVNMFVISFSSRMAVGHGSIPGSEGTIESDGCHIHSTEHCMPGLEARSQGGLSKALKETLQSARKCTFREACFTKRRMTSAPRHAGN